MIYKLGSEGPIVKEIQQVVGAEIDGYFGPNTEMKVKLWQSIQGLKSDGIVGPMTLGKMGLIDTDGAEISDEGDHTEVVGDLTIHKSYLPDGEYMKGPTKKEWLFIHHTAGWNDPYKTIKNWGNDKRGPVATEFCIGGPKITTQNDDYDGLIVQAFPEGGYGWHLAVGRRKVHTHSVGIEVNNFGQLTKGGYKNNAGDWVKMDPDKFYTYVGTEAHPDQIIALEKPFRNYKYWHNYSDAQIESLRKLILYIAKRDNIDVKKGLPEMIREKGAHEAFDFCNTDYCEKHPGLWAHTNVRSGKVDMYPHPKLVEMLLNL